MTVLLAVFIPVSHLRLNYLSYSSSLNAREKSNQEWIIEEVRQNKITISYQIVHSQSVWYEIQITLSFHINTLHTTNWYFLKHSIWGIPMHQCMAWSHIMYGCLQYHYKASQVTWAYMGSWLKRLNNALIELVSSVVCNRKAVLLTKGLFSTYQ